MIEAEDGTRICVYCVKLASQRAGLVPEGAVSCLKCKSIEGVAVRYQMVTVVWAYVGLDDKDEAIYTPLGATGAWNRDSIVTGAHCVKCQAYIPYWLLSENKYIVK